MKYQKFLLHVRKPLFYVDIKKRKIIFYSFAAVPEMFEELNCYSLNRYALTLLYHKYKTRARRIKKSFELTRIQFEKLTSSKCSYCGSPPSYLFSGRHKGKPASKKPYVYNGIDRVDSKKGYVMLNWCSLLWYL